MARNIEPTAPHEPIGIESDRRTVRRIVGTRGRSEFLEALHDDVTVRECYGPVYDGKDRCDAWFREWHADGNEVTSGTLDSFLFDPESATVAFEWDFTCQVDGDEHSFFGSRHVTFRDGLVHSITEYERAKAQYRP